MATSVLKGCGVVCRLNGIYQISKPCLGGLFPSNQFFLLGRLAATGRTVSRCVLATRPCTDWAESPEHLLSSTSSAAPPGSHQIFTPDSSSRQKLQAVLSCSGDVLRHISDLRPNTPILLCQVEVDKVQIVWCGRGEQLRNLSPRFWNKR
jgi:hypothetical protein